MKIAVIGIRGLPANYGGFETCAEHTTKHWVAFNNDVIIYCRKSHYTNKTDFLDGRKLIYTSSIPLRGFETLSNTLFSILHLCLFKRDYKNVHLYNSGNGIFVPILKLFRKKVLISVDGIEWKRQKWGRIAKAIHKIGAKFAVKFADEIITDNQEVYNVYNKTLKCESKIIAYGAKFIQKNDISIDYLTKYGLKSKEYFVFIGRLVPEKGVHHLIEKFLQLKTEKPLVIIGDDTENTEYKINLFKHSHENDNIIMPGFLYGKEYESVLANAYLYVSASELEGTSPSLLAALGAKVCTLVNGIEENLQTLGGSQVTFKECDYESLKDKWQMFIDSPELTNSKALEGYEYAKKHYKWESIAEEYLNTFRQIT